MSPTVENSLTSADQKTFADRANVKQLKTSKDKPALNLEYENKLTMCKESNFIESVLPIFQSGKSDAALVHSRNSTESSHSLIGQEDRLITNIDEKKSIACGDWPASLGEEVQRSKSCGSKVPFVDFTDVITPPDDFMTVEEKMSRQRKLLIPSAAVGDCFHDSTNETAQKTKSVPDKQRRDTTATAAASHDHHTRNNEISLAADSVLLFNSNSPSVNKSIHRSRSRPKFSPPHPPSDLLSREQKAKYDHLDRISLCQYNRPSSKAATKGETDTDEVRTIKAFSSSTTNLTEDSDDRGPPSSLRRPTPPRRSCSIPRKTVVRHLTEYNEDESRPSLSASSLDHISTAAAATPPPINNKWPLKTTRSIRAFKGLQSTEKPTAQIRPNAIRSATSDTNRSVESLIQHYNQKDSAAPNDDIHEDNNARTRHGGCKSSPFNASTKFGSLRGKLKDYVSTSNSKKQNLSSNSPNYKISSAARVKEKLGGKQAKSQATKTRDTKPSDFEIRNEEAEEGEVFENSDIRPNYVSSYLSFATPKPYMPPPRTTSLSIAAKNNVRTNSSNTLKTFLGSHKGNAPLQNSQSPNNSSRKPVLDSETITPIGDRRRQSSINIFADADKDSGVESNRFTDKLSSSSSDDLPPSANYDQNGEISFLSDFVSSTQTAAFTREATSNMSTFRNWSSSPGAAATLTEEARRRRDPSSTTVAATASVKGQKARTSEGNASEEETPIQENRRESPSTFRRSRSEDKKSHHKTLRDQQNPKGFKDNRDYFLFENLDPAVKTLMEKLRSPIPEQKRGGDKEDLEKSRDLLVAATRQFVCDSQLLVSDATRQSESLPENVRISVETLSRIAEHCVATVSILGRTSQAVILNNRVMDLTEAFKATVAAVRKAVGKPLNCPEMKALMKQATSLAANISSLLKLLNRI